MHVSRQVRTDCLTILGSWENGLTPVQAPISTEPRTLQHSKACIACEVQVGRIAQRNWSDRQHFVQLSCQNRFLAKCYILVAFFSSCSGASIWKAGTNRRSRRTNPRVHPLSTRHPQHHATSDGIRLLTLSLPLIRQLRACRHTEL